MVDINPSISIIGLNINGLNQPIKIQRLSEWIRKQTLGICCLQDTNFKYKDTYGVKVNGCRKIYPANANEKKAVLVNIRKE